MLRDGANRDAAWSGDKEGLLGDEMELGGARRPEENPVATKRHILTWMRTGLGSQPRERQRDKATGRLAGLELVERQRCGDHGGVTAMQRTHANRMMVVLGYRPSKIGTEMS